MDKLNIVVAADICPCEPIEEPLLTGDPLEWIRPVQTLFEQADLVIGNLETPLCSKPDPILKTGPAFRVDPRMAAVIRKMGFGLLTMCNNHIKDQGNQGLEETLRVLDREGLPHCGAAMTHEEAARPAVLDIRGRRVAVFNFGEGEFSQAQGDGPGTARLEFFRSGQRVQQMRGKADFILVILHSGNECQPIPSPLSAEFCRAMADAGADAVINHHPHIPQSMEARNGVPICFSLGNFLFGEDYSEKIRLNSPCWYLGSVAVLEVDDDGVRMRIHPFRQGPDLKLAELSPAGRTAMDEYLARCAAIMADPNRHRRLWEQEVRALSRRQLIGMRDTAAVLCSDDEPARKRTIAGQWNVLTSAAHLERMRTAFRLMYEDRFADDPDAAAELDALKERLLAASEG